MKRKRRPKAAAAGGDAEEAEQALQAGGATSTAASSRSEGGPRGNKKSKKTRSPESDAEVDQEEDQEDDEEDEEDAGELDVNFDFCDPNESDYHSVRDLLKNGTWEFVDLNFSEMADAVVGQGNIGTLIKSVSSSAVAGPASDVDETVCALLTTLNLRQFPDLSWPKVISDALVAKARKHAAAGVADQLEALLQRRDGKSEVGLLLSERFVNLPLDLLPAFHKALTDDIEWSCTTPDCPEEERPFYHFTHFVGVARCHADGAAEATSSAAMSQGKMKKKRKVAGSQGAPSLQGLQGLTFNRPEDQVYVRRASFSFSFPMPTSSAPKKAKGGLGPADQRPEKRVVFALTKQALWQAVAEIPEAMASLE